MKTINEKMCLKCSTLKNSSEFYKFTSRPDGLQAHCKVCFRIHEKKKREKRAADGLLEAYRIKHREAAARSAANNKESVAIGRRLYDQRNKVKIDTHKKVARMVKRGALIRQECEICGNGKAFAHHDDYAKPLDVRWLCSVHHKAWHIQNGPGKNGQLPQGQ